MKKILLTIFMSLVLLAAANALDITDADYVLEYYQDNLTGGNWVSSGSAGTGHTQGGTMWVNNSNCIGENGCLAFNGSHGQFSDSHILGNPVGDNWTIAVALNTNTSISGWNRFIGGDRAGIRVTSGGVFTCQREQTSGTQFLRSDFSSTSTDTDYVLFCYGNTDTGVCAQTDNGSASCNSYDGNANSQQFWQVDEGGTEGVHISSLYIWSDRTLNETEQQAVYDCMINDQDLANDCGIGGGSPPVTEDRNLLFNISDLQTGSLTDHSTYNHSFTLNGDTSITTAEVGNTRGSINFSATSGDTINSTFKANMTQAALRYRIYFENQPGSGNAMAAYQFEESSFLMRTQYSTYAFNPDWRTTGTDVTLNTAGTCTVSAGGWYDIFEQYNGSTYQIYMNGQLCNSASADGDLYINVGDLLQLGTWGSTNLEGYMSEFQIWDKGDFNQTEIQAMYDADVQGTPPDIDLYVSEIMYDLPYYQNASNHTLLNDTGSMWINFTITNAGVNATGAFNYSVYLGGITVHTGYATDLIAGGSTTVSFQWTKSYGFHNGGIDIDVYDNVTEEDENNNYQTLYVPFMNRPWIFVNNCDDPMVGTAEQNRCNTYSTFVSENFNPSWTADNVDPRGKKGFENAVGCAINAYPITSTQCQYALNHLKNWTQLPYSDWNTGDVQALHQVGYVGLIYDTIFPMLTPAEIDELAPYIENVSQALAYHSDTRPDINPALSPIPNPGNGWAFFSGTYWYSLLTLGVGSENPMQIMDDPATYQKASIYEYWNARAESFLQGFANNSNASYAEPSLYFFYGGVPISFHTYIMDKMNISFSQDYSNAYDAMARELLFLALDYNYDGQTLRNDENQNWRVRSIGDTNSYEDWGSNTEVGFGYITLLGLNARDQDLKDSLFSLRNTAYDSGEQKGIMELFAYRELNATATDNGITAPVVRWDEQYETLCIRNGWTFQRDNLFCIDGGDHFFSGHPYSQSFFKYSLGEPFLDYPQVALNDDTRGEQWHNGISYVSHNDTVGQQYVEGCSDAANNEYIGDNDCTTIGDYPNFRRVPMNYSGNVTNVFYTEDGYFSTWKRIKPMANSEPLVEYWVKINDTEILRAVVSENQDNRIVDGYTNIYQEFDATINGNNVTFNRVGTNYYVEVSTLYINETVDEFYSVDTGKNASKTKTVENPQSRTYMNVTYRRTELVVNEANVDLIKGYTSYNVSKENTLNYYNDSVEFNNATIYFDMDNDGVINAGLWETDGWALAVDINGSETYMASGATYVLYNNQELFNGSESSFLSTYNATVTNETNPPSIVLISPLNGSQVNISSQVELAVNVTDNTNVSDVWVTVNYPNGSSVDYTLSMAAGDKYNVSISAQLLGTHNLSFQANDTYNNMRTYLSQFEVVDLESPTWTVEPTNTSFINNTLFTRQYNATDNVAVDWFFLNDTTYFNITQNGLLTAKTATAGNYTFNVSVNDTSNNILTKSITIEIQAFNDGLGLVNYTSYELYTNNTLNNVTYYTGLALDVNNYYVLIYADNVTSYSFSDLTLTNLGNGVYKLNATTETDWEIQRALVMEELFYGSTPQILNNFGNVTRLLSNDERDTGKRAIYLGAIGNFPPGGSPQTNTYYETTLELEFYDQTNNTGVSAWSRVDEGVGEPVYSLDGDHLGFELPTGTTVNTCSRSTGDSGTTTCTEIGTDTSGDDVDNPTGVRLRGYSGKDAQDDTGRGASQAVILTASSYNITENTANQSISTNLRTYNFLVDYYDNHSVPLFEFAYNITSAGFEMEPGNYTVIANKDPYFNITQEFEVNFDTDQEVNFYGFYNTIVNITLTEAFSGDSAEDFNVSVESNIYNDNLSANGTYIEIPFLLTYDLTVNVTDESYIPVNVTETINTNPFLIALTAFRSIELNINFFDEETLEAVNNVTFEMLGLFVSNTFNTGVEDNSFYIAPLTDGIYEIRYGSTGYTDRSYHFQIPLNDEDNVNISLFLVADDISQIFLRTITDQGNNPLDTYYLEVQRPYPSTDNTSLIYRSLEIASIDSQGDAVFTAIPNTQQYRFRILDENLQLTNTLSPSYLVDSSSTIIATESTNIMDDFNAGTDSVTDLYYQNTTSSFVFDYTAPLTVDQVCLEVTNNTGFTSSKQVVCSTSNSGTLAIIVDDEQNVTYEAVGYVYPSATVKIPVDSDSKDFQFRGSREVVRYIGAFLYVMVLILCATIGGFRNPVPAVILGIVSTAAFGVSFLGLLTFSTLMLGGLLIIGVLVLLLTKESDS